MCIGHYHNATCNSSPTSFSRINTVPISQFVLGMFVILLHDIFVHLCIFGQHENVYFVDLESIHSRDLKSVDNLLGNIPTYHHLCIQACKVKSR